MDMSPTSVPAVNCQAVSPLPIIQYGYGLTVFTLLQGLPVKGAYGDQGFAPRAGWTRPGRSAYLLATVNVSHRRVSGAFPVCYADGNVPGHKPIDVSGVCRDRPGTAHSALLFAHRGNGVSFP